MSAILPYFFVGLFITFFISNAFALDPNKLISQFSHTNWSAKDGISGTVRAITQTQDGYLWLGTEAGLYRFDGLQFVRWESSSDTKLPKFSVLSLLAARDGSLWIGFGAGKISRLFNGKVTTYSNEDGIPEGEILAIAEDSKGTIWAGGTYGFVRFDGEKWHRIGKEMNYLAPGLQTLLVDTEGNLWAATDGFNYGLGDPKIEPNTILKLSPEKSVFEETGADLGMVWNIKEAPDKSIWATNTSSIEIQQINGKAGEKLSVLVGGSAMTIHFDGESDLWIGYFDSGIYKTTDFRKIEVKNFDKFPLKTGNSYQAVFSVFEDREGNIWFGTDNGIHRFRENKVKSFSTQEGLPFDKQLAVISSSNGTPNFFAYTGNSILSFSDNKFTDFLLPAYSQIDSTRMLSIYSDPDGSLWLGGSFGIAKKLNEKVTYIKHPEIENRAMVEAIVKDKEENIWFTITGTDSVSRIMRLKNNQITNFSEIVEFPKYRSRILFADQIGRVWFGFENGVIAVYENSEFRFYSAKDGLPSGKIFVITKDKKDNILIGSEGGLSRFENGSFKTLTTENGLLGNSVSGIIEDDDGFIWLAESTAIFRVSPDELELSFSDPAHKMQGIAFDANDGLRGLPRQHEPFPTAAKSGDGKLWFTTTAGISVIDPRNWHKNTVIPPVTVEYVKIDDEILSDFEKLELQPNPKNILFNYTALSLSNPEKVFFRYKLEGYDQDWRDSTHRREAGYTNLPPGKYVFRVIACNNDGIWNEEGASLSFTILPAFYQTFWFYILCLAGFAALCLFLYQRRLQQVKKRLNMQFEERLSERTRIARELHDSLLQGIVSASMQLNVTADNLPQNSKTKPQLNRVINLIGEVIKEGRNTLHGLRSFEDSSISLEQSFSQIQQSLALTEEINFKLVTVGNSREICPPIKDEIYLIGREAIINAFNHSQAHNIEVELEFFDKHFRLLIRDDGIGIDPKILETGKENHWGLTGMRERAAKIGGKLKIYSQEKVGTEIELFVPGYVAFQNEQDISTLNRLKKLFSKTDKINEKKSDESKR